MYKLILAHFHSSRRVCTSRARTQNTSKSRSRNLESQYVSGSQRKMLVSRSRKVSHLPFAIPYMVIAQLEMKLPAYKVALFHHCIGVDALKICNGFQFDSVEDKMTWQRYYKSSTSSPSENWTRPLKGTLSAPEINKKTKAFMLVTALRPLAKTCNFYDSMRDSIICDRIVLDIQDHRTCKRLLQERNLTLSKCIDPCKSSEATHVQLLVFTWRH